MIYQVSTFVENKPGYLRRITSLLKKEGVSIRAMTLSGTSSSWGVFNLIVSNPEEVCQLLNDNGHSTVLRQIVAVEMADIAGGLDTMLAKLEELDINIENAYARGVNDNENAFLIIDTQDIDDAAARIKNAGINILSKEIVYGTK